MISSGLSGKPTLYGLLALSAMEFVALQEPGTPLAKLQQPTRGLERATAVAPRPAPALSNASEPAEAMPSRIDDPTFAEGTAIASQSVSRSILFPADAAFHDLKSHWSQPFVELLAARGIVSGYGDGTFQPDGTIQAAHFGIMLHQAKLYRIKMLRRDLSVVASISPVQPQRHLAAAAPSVSDTEAEQLLRTHDIRTRAQAAVFIYRNLEGTVVSQSPVQEIPKPLADTGSASPVQSFEPSFADPTEVRSPSLVDGFQWSLVDSTWIAQG